VGAILDVLPELERLALEMYSQATCGASLTEVFGDGAPDASSSILEAPNWPFFLHRVSEDQPAYEQALGVLRALARRRRESGPAAGSPPTILDTLVRARDAQGSPLSDDESARIARYGFTGGCAYVARLVGFLLQELLSQPDLLEQVRTEVDPALAEGVEDAADVRKLRLLQAVYHETLRFHPLSQGLAYEARHDFVHLGRQVRQGDAVLLSPTPMSFSACPFREPDRFDPERCLEPRSEHRREQAFHPFGMGRRTCAGTGLVELMAVTLAAVLVHELRFSPDDASPAADGELRFRVDGPREPLVAAADGLRLVEDEVLASFPGLDDPEVRAALASAEVRSYPAGADIIREGDPADGFYVLLQGGADVVRATPAGEQSLARLEEGSYFGEIGLLQDVPRTATVRACESGAETLVLGREAFAKVVAVSDLVSEDLARIVRKRIASQRVLEAWTGLSADKLERVMSDFEAHTYAPGAQIIREGDDADQFFILIEGEVVVSREARSGNEEEVARLGPGEYFGEMGLLYRSPRRATVTVAASGPATALATDRAGFQKLLGETGGMRTELARAMLVRIKKLALHRS
jgi:CRP-like cAMP-binding protein/cytochrome P450